MKASFKVEGKNQKQVRIVMIIFFIIGLACGYLAVKSFVGDKDQAEPTPIENPQ